MPSIMGCVLQLKRQEHPWQQLFPHVIFDLDGTILNTLEDLAAAGNHT